MTVVELVENPRAAAMPLPSERVLDFYVPMFADRTVKVVAPFRLPPFGDIPLLKHFGSDESETRYSDILRLFALPENIAKALSFWTPESVEILKKSSRDLNIDYLEIFEASESAPTDSLLGKTRPLYRMIEKDYFRYSIRNNKAGVTPWDALPVARYFGHAWAVSAPRFVTSLPQSLPVYSGEAWVPSAVDGICTLVKSGQIPAKIPRAYTNTDLRIVSGLVSIVEPIPRSVGRSAAYAARVLVSLAVAFSGRLQGGYIQFLKDFFGSDSDRWKTPKSEILMQMALPAFQGGPTPSLEPYGLMLIKTLAALMYQPGADVHNPRSYPWLSMDDLKNRLYQSSGAHSLSACYSGPAPASLDKDPRYLSWSEVTSEIYPLMVKGISLMLAVMGLAEVALSPDPKAGIAGVEYVRPTALLSYVTERISSYDLSEATDAPTAVPLILSTDSLTLVASGKDFLKPFEDIIDTRQSVTRAVVSRKSLLHGSGSPARLDEFRTRLLTLSRAGSLPAIWQRLFDSASDAFMTVTAVTLKYETFRIVSDYSRVRGLIEADADLSPHVVFAEQNLFLIDTPHVRLLERFISRHGFSLKLLSRLRGYYD
ncbi:MAG: hypothetical protein K2M19_01910 [Muribaculaceae bacterium]|nr:hypothetical protein [Muribaculaceae bacterium]